MTEFPAVSLPPAYNGLPLGATVILKESWQPLNKLKFEADVLGKGNEFGVGRIMGPVAVAFNTGEVQSTPLLVPTHGRVLPVFVNTSDNSANRNSEPEPRVKAMLLAMTEGVSLEVLIHPWQLCEAIAHSLLGMFWAFE